MLKIIENARLYTNPDETADILVANGRVERIERRLDWTDSETIRLDAGGRLAIPGYFDLHVHVTGGGGEGCFANRVPELTISQAVNGGVTSLVGLLGTDGVARSVESLVAKTKALNEEGLTAYCLTGSYGYPSATITGSVAKDIMFISEVIGVKIAISDHRSPELTVDELIRLAADARVAGILSGKPGVVHLHTGRGKGGLELIFKAMESSDVPAGTFRPTHLGKCFEDAVKFANMGGYADFTAGSPQKTAAMVYEATQRAPAELITISSDGNGSMPIWNDKLEMIGMGVGSVDVLHETTRLLVCEYGMPWERAILPGSLNPARSLGLAGRKGSIAAGLDADILLLDDALDIDCVLAMGEVMMWDKQILAKGRFEA